MENQHQNPIQEKTSESEAMAPIQAKSSEGSASPPPPFQLKAGDGFDSTPAVQMKAFDGPVQRLGTPTAPQGQAAGTCGIFSITHSIAHLYSLNATKTQAVRDLMLKAGGTVDKTVSAEGEITSFAVAEAIVAEYNKLTSDYKIKLTQKTVDSNASDKASWRSALGLEDTSSEADHAATLAVDSSIYYPALKAAFALGIGGEATKNGTTCKVNSASKLTFSALGTVGASTHGSGAHWITIVEITSDHVVCLDSNLKNFKLYFAIADAYKLSDSLKAATRGEYLDEVYGGSGKEGDWVKGMRPDADADWGTMLGTSDGATIESTITDRLEKTDRTTDVALKGLSLKVEKA